MNLNGNKIVIWSTPVERPPVSQEQIQALWRSHARLARLVRYQALAMMAVSVGLLISSILRLLEASR